VKAKEDESEAISAWVTTAVPRTDKVAPSHNIQSRHQPNHGKHHSLLPLQADQKIVLLHAVALHIQSADLEHLNAYDLSSEREEIIHNNDIHQLELQSRKLSDNDNNNTKNKIVATTAGSIKRRTPVKRAASAMAKLAQNLVALEKELAPDQQHEPSQPLPVKLDYDKIRPRHPHYLHVEYEWALMKRLNAALSKNCSYGGELGRPRPPSIILTPYQCLSGDNAALTQWLDWCHMPPNGPTTAASPWALQFVKGNLDVRLLISLTETLAHLHGWRRFERAMLEHMNERHTNVRSILPYGASLHMTTRLRLGTQAQHEPECRVQRLIQDIGEQVCSVMMGAMINDLHRADCVIHNDCNLFNVLVAVEENNMNGDQDTGDHGKTDYSVDEKKNEDITTSLGMDNLARISRLVLPSWKMARLGPIGRDLGLPIAWPIACLLWHASQGRDYMVAEIWDFVQAFWEEYSEARWAGARTNMRGATLPAATSKQYDHLDPRIFRSMIAWCGWYLYVKIYQQLEHLELFLFTGPDAMTSRFNVLESIGVVGLKYMHLGFSGAETDLSLEKLKMRFAVTILEEQDCNHLLRNKSRSMLNEKTLLGFSRIALLRRVIEHAEEKQ